MNRPIGIFDSGIGGLSVVKELRKILPNEEIIYFGDTARLPYGTKSKETIAKFSLENAKFLITRGVKMIIVACHSSASAALDDLTKRIDLPIIGVIEPGARAALKSDPTKKIGVIGTQATISSGAYERVLRQFGSKGEIIGRACPLFVPLVEEGWLNHKITYLIAEEYLAPLLRDKIDILILGCTHYPLLKDVISQVMKGVKLIDPAVETAQVVKTVLEKNNILTRSSHSGRLLIYLSDLAPHFKEIGQRFLGEEIRDVALVKLEEE
ncbi:MAG: glutamate racemase [candidate division WOR-3 bacterium]